MKNNEINRTGNTLAHRMKSLTLDLDRIVALAIQIVDALDPYHRGKRFYGFLNPAIIMVDPETRQVSLPEIEKPAEDTDYLANNNLGYISPELTGRMNRIVDYRTDYYSLGAVLYEVLTGAPPLCH